MTDPYYDVDACVDDIEASKRNAEYHKVVHKADEATDNYVVAQKQMELANMLLAKWKRENNWK